MIVRIRLWPNEIEADLQREYGIDIRDWHRGVLSSRRILVLLENLTDDSRYKAESERNGNWPVWLQILKDVHKEVAMHRAALYAGGDNEYDPMIYLDPVERKERVSEKEPETPPVDDFLYKILGWN